MDNNEQQKGQRRGCPVKRLASKVKIDNYDSLLIYMYNNVNNKSKLQVMTSNELCKRFTDNG